MASITHPSPSATASIPQTQNTAPILEFRCLFTPDLRRKQKRWQDGRLKFHTFNKRVMVYDDRMNYVGDTHWHDYTLEEGEELELERGGVLVQVADCMGRKEQDLEELLGSVRGRRREDRTAGREVEGVIPGMAARSGGIASRRQMVGTNTQSQKPLRDLLGTPSGHHGRALVLITSPFEERQNMSRKEMDTAEKPAKRRKLESPYAKAGYAQKLTGVTLDLSNTPQSTAPLRREPLWARTSRRQEGHENPGQDGRDSMQSDIPQETSRKRQKLRLASEKEIKSGYAQSLTGAVLDLSSTQKTNDFLRRRLPLARAAVRDEEGLITKPSSESLDIILQPESAQSRVSREPALKKRNIAQEISEKDSATIADEIIDITEVAAERPPTSVSKPNKVRSRIKSREQESIVTAANASGEPISADDEFIDIDTLVQKGPVRTSPIISTSNDALQDKSPQAQSHRMSSPPLPDKSSTVPTVEQIPPPVQEKSSAEPLRALRLKSRPKRRMLLLDQNPPPLAAIANQVAALPARDVVPEPSQATRRLEEFHKEQREKLEARIGKTAHTKEQDSHPPSPPPRPKDAVQKEPKEKRRLEAFHSVERGQREACIEDTTSTIERGNGDTPHEDNAENEDIGIDHNDIDRLSSRKPSISLGARPRPVKTSRSGLSLPENSARPERSQAMPQEHCPAPPRPTTNPDQHPILIPSTPQSSEPGFEELKSVAERLRSKTCTVNGRLSRQSTASTIAQEVSQPVKPNKHSRASRRKEEAPVDDNAKVRNDVVSISPTTDTPPTETPQANPPAKAEAPMTQRKAPQLVRIKKSIRSKEIVGWVDKEKDRTVLLPLQARDEILPQPQPQPKRQAPMFKPVTRAVKETVAPADIGVPSAKAPQHVLPRRSPAMKQNAAAGLDRGGLGKADTGPWSREAFDLFDWRPKQL
jgi:hypothetical protein